MPQGIGSVIKYERKKGITWNESGAKTGKLGVIIVNLGTPNSLDLVSVKEYLREFLLDPYVVNLPNLLRSILVKGIIVPFRSKNTLEAYKEVWTEEGSPLKVLSQNLVDMVDDLLPDVAVELAMRYQNPSISEAYHKLLKKDIDRVLVLPLFPQYARATTGTIVAHVEKLIEQKVIQKPVVIAKPFYDQSEFISSWSESINNSVSKANKEIEHYLFSYHSLPVKQLIDGEYGCSKASCFAGQPCPKISDTSCYRAQCYATTSLITSKLGIPKSKYTVVFQSKVGFAKWLEPSLTSKIDSLAKDGIKNIIVASPSFMVDCLETIEEIGIRAKEQFEEVSGGDLYLASCPNDSSLSAVSIAELIKSYV